MHYYKYIGSNEQPFQYEMTTRIINSANVVEITQEEYDAFIATLPVEEPQEEIGD